MTDHRHTSGNKSWCVTMLQKLKRIVAVAGLLATACFVILWMRSLKQFDTLHLVGPSVDWLSATSSGGMLILSRTDNEKDEEADEDRDLGWVSWERDIGFVDSILLMPKWESNQREQHLHLPLWLVIAIGGLTGIALLARRPIRFSLRTLAIAATLIVLTLGLGVAASRLTLG